MTESGLVMRPHNCPTVEELENDCRIWEQNARGVLAKLKDEQAKNRNLMNLIWAIVLKHGGETRLSDSERGILRDDWELLEYTDMETLELVIKARVKALEKDVADLAAKERERRAKAGPQHDEDSHTAAKWQGKITHHNNGR